jgi:hypothetical protein
VKKNFLENRFEKTFGQMGDEGEAASIEKSVIALGSANNAE